MATKNLNAEERIERRATYERFTMVVCENGYVNIRNDSYGDDRGEHIYSVEVRDGRVRSCSCPHAVYRNERCKHQEAVQDRPIVVSSASNLSQTYEGTPLTDGGQDDDGTDDRDDSDDDTTGYEEPVRFERADFGHGESTGVEEL